MNAMNDTPTSAVVKKPAGSMKMITTLAGVTFFSGLLIVCAVKITENRIAANKRAALNAAVFAVLPGAETSATFEITDAGLVAVDEPSADADRIYAGYDDQGRLVGVAISAIGLGYAGPVETIFGYSPAADLVIGFKVLASLETPGLGSRVGDDPEFLSNFTALDVALNADGSALEHPITFVKHGEKKNPWEIDGISGATISSTAVAKAVSERSQALIPMIKKNLDQLKETHE